MALNKSYRQKKKIFEKKFSKKSLRANPLKQKIIDTQKVIVEDAKKEKALEEYRARKIEKRDELNKMIKGLVNQKKLKWEDRYYLR